MAASARRLRSDERGFTLIELMVSISVLAVGVFGLIGSIDSGRKLNTVAENNTAMTHVGQRQIERLHDMPYSALALTAAPSPNASDPADRFVCTGATYNWDRTGCASVNKEPLVVVGGTGVSSTIPGVPTSQSWFDARTNARGVLRTYVTWVDDSSCTNARACSTPRDYKRITVVVVLANGRPRTPTVLTSFAYDTDSAGRICSDAELKNGSSQPIGGRCG